MAVRSAATAWARRTGRGLVVLVILGLLALPVVAAGDVVAAALYGRDPLAAAGAVLPLALMGGIAWVAVFIWQEVNR